MSTRGDSRCGIGHAVAPLLLRLAVGATFVVHGLAKITHGFSPSGIPMAEAMRYVVPVVEFAGGILLVAGFATRIAALGHAALMAGAIYYVHWGQGFRMHAVLVDGQARTHGWEWQALLLSAALALVLMGAGPLSVDGMIARRRRKAREIRAA